MNTAAEYRKYAEEHQKVRQTHMATLRRLRQGLLKTQLVIERAALAYIVSRWALDRIERERSFNRPINYEKTGWR